MSSVLHCIPSMGGGGAERQLTYLAHGLSRRGWHVHVSYNRAGPNLSRLHESGASIHSLAVEANHDPRLPLRIAALIRRIKPDIVQTWLPQMDIAGGLAATMLNVPWIVSERSSEGSYPAGVKTRARRQLARASAAAIIANSQAGARYWAGGNGKQLRAFVVPNGIPLDEIQRSTPAELSNYGIAADERLVVFIGRFSPEKNLPLLIDALAQAAETHAFKALLCGDGPLLTAMRALVQQRGLGQRVFLPGYLENVWGVLKRACVFASLSSYEGHPNGVLEALACGCGLVVSEIETHRACVTDAVADFVPLDDVGAAQRAIAARLDASATEATATRIRAQSFAQGWSLEEMARQYESIYASILSAPMTRLPAQVS